MQFADEMEGVALQDLWDDIPPESGEKSLGYPTQKPEAFNAGAKLTSYAGAWFAGLVS